MASHCRGGWERQSWKGFVTAGAIFGTGYIERIQVSTFYYQRLHPVDLPAFDALRSGSGTVATSWEGGLQDEGSVSAWFVESLAKRPALGPGAPWLSTLADVGPDELDMQRFFSGDLGIENGALQASVSPTGALRDPAIQGNVNGFYYPLAYVNSLANSYPISVQPGAVPTRAGSALQYRHMGTGGNGSILETISLDGNATVITYTLQGANVSARLSTSSLQGFRQRKCTMMVRRRLSFLRPSLRPSSGTLTETRVGASRHLNSGSKDHHR